jgi:hypothetical protein
MDLVVGDAGVAAPRDLSRSISDGKDDVRFTPSGARRAGDGGCAYRESMLRAAEDMSDGDWTLIWVLLGVLAVATLIGAIVLVVKVWKTKKMLGALGAGGNVAFYGALIYTIFPVDLLPDPVYLDDMGVLTAALIYLTKLYHKRRAEREELAPAPGARR